MILLFIKENLSTKVNMVSGRPQYNLILKRSMKNSSKIVTSIVNGAPKPTQPCLTKTPSSPTEALKKPFQESLPNKEASQETSPSPSVPTGISNQISSIPLGMDKPMTSIAEQLKDKEPGYYMLSTFFKGEEKMPLMEKPEEDPLEYDENSSNQETASQVEFALKVKDPTVEVKIIKLNCKVVQTGNGDNLGKHEETHLLVVSKDKNGLFQGNVIATSAKNNTITGAPNLDFGAPNIVGNQEKKQRMAALESPRVFSPDLKEGVHYEVPPAAAAYFDQLNDVQKDQIEQLSKRGNVNKIPVYRQPHDASSNYNQLGLRSADECINTDFMEIQKNDEID